MTQQEIIEIAYRVIRREVRRFDRNTNDAELANYIKGVVDFQTEIYMQQERKSENDCPLSGEEIDNLLQALAEGESEDRENCWDTIIEEAEEYEADFN